MNTAQLDWRESGNDEAVLAVSGHCTMAHLPDLLARIDGLRRAPSRIDLSGVETLDSAGALVLLRLLDRQRRYRDALPRIAAARPEHQALLELVAERAGIEPAVSARHSSWREWMVKFGEAIGGFADHAWQLAGFFGTVNHCFWAILTGKRKLRMTSVVHHMERTGLDAVPIVALLCFLVGAVVAFLSATALRDFGASILTVEIVAVSFLREFGVLLSAILVAGRSGSAFTAQIGSMKSREELDAIQALGLDSIELLVIPRLLALFVMLPLLTFIAMIMGIVGGGIVGTLALDITPGMFIARLQEMTSVDHFWVGMVKAPVFAFLIATVGCLEGFKVEGSAESVGRHTTASVVQSIFLVIVFDSLFAMFFMEMDI